MSDRHQVRLLPVAEEDLEEIVGYVALDDAEAASKLADRIEANLLSSFPELGRVPRDGDLREAGYRYVIIGEWLAFCTIEKHRLRAQDPPRATRLQRTAVAPFARRVAHLRSTLPKLCTRSH